VDLRSGCTYWPDLTPDVPSYGPLGRDLSCDVAILGGGITGALAAHYLTREGLHTVMLDRRPVGGGSTAASTGLLQYELDTLLVDLVNLVGRERACRAYRVSHDSLDHFPELVQDVGDPCGLERRPSLYLASGDADVEKLKRECEARRSIGIAVELLAEAAVRKRFPFSRPAALWSAKAMEVDPYRLTHRLIAKAVGRGLEVFAETEASAYEPTGDGVTLRTVDGPTVRARHVVFATGYETPQFVGRDICWCTLKSTFAMVSQPLPGFEGWPERCLIWESARPYFYLRTTPDGRAMLGGEDEDFADPKRRDRLIGEKAQTLARKFRAMFPRIDIEPDCAWAGTFAETADGLPYVGAVPQFPRGYFALGYGGNGISFSLVAARIITDLIMGRPNADADLFAFGR
jgi:glycine/D-amino acid oxidase-like deaminating enzyme